MPEIKNRKIVFLKVESTAAGTFNYNFNVPFFVDDMIVKNWTCGGSPFVDPVMCHMVGVGDLFSFEYDNSQTINNVFHLHRNIDGNNTFTLQSYTGGIYASAAGIILMVCFEFIEYVR